MTTQDETRPPAKAPEPDWTRQWADAKALLVRLGPSGPLAIVSATLPAIGFVTLAFAFTSVGPWLKAQESWGLAIYIAAFATTAGLAILPTHIQAALGGWAFGFAAGFPAAMAGVLGASLIGYVVGRRTTGERVTRLIAEKAKWQAVYTALIGSGFWRSLLIVTLLRTALSPFALTNFVLAATRVRLSVYVLATVVGLAPRTGVAVFFAVGLQQITDKEPHSRWVWIASVILSIVVVYVIGFIAKNAVSRITTAASRS